MQWPFHDNDISMCRVSYEYRASSVMSKNCTFHFSKCKHSYFYILYPCYPNGNSYGRAQLLNAKLLNIP